MRNGSASAPTIFVAHALVRAASRLISTPVLQQENPASWLRFRCSVGQTIVFRGLPGLKIFLVGQVGNLPADCQSAVLQSAIPSGVS